MALGERSPVRTFREFIALESSAGLILFVAALVALVVDNSAWHHYYHALFSQTFLIQLGDYRLAKPVLMWVNDGLMVFFFLLVGLEVKRELFEGELNSRQKAVLPGIAAIGGMAGPALIYILLNHNDPRHMPGWAIPTATDIAFSLAILALLRSRIPAQLKVFLTALAIFDDIGAIVIIAIFYTKHISITMLAIAAALTVGLLLLNRFKVTHRAPYFLVGLVMWVCVLKSGVHATLVGIIIAFAIPLRIPSEQDISPSRDVEHALHPWVAFLVLPIFAFANAGVSFKGLSWGYLLHPLPLGIMLGLVVGKQVGIFGSTWLAVKLKWARLPEHTSWSGIYGIALVAGVGFTMSLFIGGLAFGEGNIDYKAMVRLGVLLGSLVSGVAGYLVLRMAHRQPLSDEG